jgi:REP element-mobilizing transposase RayT
MGHSKQLSLVKSHWKFRYSYGGSLRNHRLGRGARPLSTKEPLHLVFKGNRSLMRRGYRSPLGFQICNAVIKKYAKKFFVQIEQQAICGDHIHLLVRFSKRSQGQYFLRVVAGQIAQQFEKNGFLKASVKVTDTSSGQGDTPSGGQIHGITRAVTDTPNGRNADQDNASEANTAKPKLWKYRPFSRVVKAWKDYLGLKSYVRLNEKEATKEIPYRKERLKGLSAQDWEILWK